MPHPRRHNRKSSSPEGRLCRRQGSPFTPKLLVRAAAPRARRMNPSCVTDEQYSTLRKTPGHSERPKTQIRQSSGISLWESFNRTQSFLNELVWVTWPLEEQNVSLTARGFLNFCEDHLSSENGGSKAVFYLNLGVLLQNAALTFFL